MSNNNSTNIINTINHLQDFKVSIVTGLNNEIESNINLTETQEDLLKFILDKKIKELDICITFLNELQSKGFRYLTDEETCINTTKISLSLKEDSWKNIIHCIRNSEIIAVGNFWSVIQHLESQLEEKK